MKKFLLLFLLSLAPLFAKSMEVKYDITFSFFGKIGESIVKYETIGNHYKITVTAVTMGITAKLTSNRIETYISEGKIINNILRPDTFISSKKSDKKIRIKTYRFDHQNQIVILDINTTKIKNKRSFNLQTLSIIETKKEVKYHSSKTYNFYATDDTLSLFFNTPAYLGDTLESQSKEVRAIGINKDGSGINITIPSLKREQKIRKMIAVAHSHKFYTIDVSKDILTKDDAAGELIISMDEKNMPSAVLMENIAFFGDIKAKKISENIQL